MFDPELDGIKDISKIRFKTWIIMRPRIVCIYVLSRDALFPLQKRAWDDLLLWAPRQSDQVLTSLYPGWEETCVSAGHSHREQIADGSSRTFT